LIEERINYTFLYLVLQELVDCCSLSFLPCLWCRRRVEAVL